MQIETLLKQKINLLIQDWKYHDFRCSLIKGAQMKSSGLTFLYLLLSGSFLGTVTLRASPFQFQVRQKKSKCLAPGKVLIKVYSDWSSLDLGPPFNQSHLSGESCALIGQT